MEIREKFEKSHNGESVYTEVRGIAMFKNKYVGFCEDEIKQLKLDMAIICQDKNDEIAFLTAVIAQLRGLK